MATIYKATSKCGKVYVGVTVSELRLRVASHKHQSKTRRYNDFSELLNKHGEEYFVFSKIEECKNTEMFDREKHWISFYKNKGISLNNSLGGKGPLGVKHSKEANKHKSEIGKKLWANPVFRKKIMAAKMPSLLDSEAQRKKGILGSKARWSKQPFFKVYDRKTKKQIGRFQTKTDFAKAIGVSSSTTGRYLSGKLKIGSVLYRIVWE